MTCHISNQIAKHCNPDEVICPKCNANMYYSDNNEYLHCSECKNVAYFEDGKLIEVDDE